ncbi:MAG: TA system VapC family ribonuclease toxin [Bryobacteraceae bacterium]
MSLLCFPDVNVWLALSMGGHAQRQVAVDWWRNDHSDTIAFCRLTQVSVLRLLTTAEAMNGKPLTMPQAWAAYDQFFGDDRVRLAPEPPEVELCLRRMSSLRRASPKLWADAYLSACAEAAGGTVITFDRALARRAPRSLLLTR